MTSPHPLDGTHVLALILGALVVGLYVYFVMRSRLKRVEKQLHQRRVNSLGVGDEKEKPIVRTSPTGGKYVISEEAIQTRRFQGQLARLKRKLAREAGVGGAAA